MQYTPLPQSVVEELIEMRDALERIGDGMLAANSYDEQFHIGAAFHSIAKLVGYPIDTETEK